MAKRTRAEIDIHAGVFPYEPKAKMADHAIGIVIGRR
jgi:hypothetical protein